MATLYDVSAFQATASGFYNPALATATTGGVLISGSQKLAQRFLLALLTETGSMTFLPTRGTSFITDASSGGFQTEADVLTSFSLAMLTLTKFLQNEETTSIPDDERFVSAKITKITIGNGLLNITIEITNLAGTTSLVNLPLQFNL